MGKDWIERKDGAFLAQARNFTDRVAADPAALGLSEDDSARLSFDCAAFASAYQTAYDPTTRTAPAIAMKDIARQQLVATMRDLGRRVRVNSAISDAVKIGLMLTVPSDTQSAPAGAPDSRPIATIKSIVNNLIAVTLADENTPTTRTRPNGVAGAQVFYCAGKSAPTNLENWRSPVITLSGKATIRLPYLPPGTMIWIIARWFDNRGRTGPTSMAKCAHVGSITLPGMMAA